VTVTGNVISNTSVLIDIHTATDITVTGNTFFAPNPDFIHATACKRLNLNGNTFNPRQFVRPSRLVFNQYEDSIISNCTFYALNESEGAIQLDQCQRMALHNNILSDSESGVLVTNSQAITIKDWTASGIPANQLIRQDEISTVNRWESAQFNPVGSSFPSGGPEPNDRLRFHSAFPAVSTMSLQSE